MEMKQRQVYIRVEDANSLDARKGGTGIVECIGGLLTVTLAECDVTLSVRTFRPLMLSLEVSTQTDTLHYVGSAVLSDMWITDGLKFYRFTTEVANTPNFKEYLGRLVIQERYA